VCVQGPLLQRARKFAWAHQLLPAGHKYFVTTCIYHNRQLPLFSKSVRIHHHMSTRDTS
jgi:hypothetical protein